MTRHVTSLALSRRLKELGVGQESAYFFWSTYCGAVVVPFDHDLCSSVHDCMAGENPCGGQYPRDLLRWAKEEGEEAEIFAAFMSSELGEMLPDGQDFIHYKLVRGGYRIDHPRTANWFESDTEPDARAKMLVYLIESGIVNVQEVNERMGG